MRRLLGGIAVSLALMAAPALAAQCSSTGANFESWKKQFAAEAKANGVSARAISALMSTRYATATIYADRHQHSFHLGLGAFMAKRGAPAIVSQGRRMKAANAALFASIHCRRLAVAITVAAVSAMSTTV